MSLHCQGGLQAVGTGDAPAGTGDAPAGGEVAVLAAELRACGSAGQAGLSLQQLTLASSWKMQSLALGKQFRPVVVRDHLDGFIAGLVLGTEALALLGQVPFVPLAIPRWDVQKWACQSHSVHAQTPVMEQG